MGEMYEALQQLYYPSECSTLIGPAPSRYFALIGWDHGVAMPALLCHKDTAQGTQIRWQGAFMYCLSLSLWHKGPYNKFFLCLEVRRELASATPRTWSSTWSGAVWHWVRPGGILFTWELEIFLLGNSGLDINIPPSQQWIIWNVNTSRQSAVSSTRGAWSGSLQGSVINLTTISDQTTLLAGPVPVFSTLIGRGMSRLSSHWSRDVATPALLCHKEPGRGSPRWFFMP